MMLFGIEILAATYIATKVVEKIKTKKTQKDTSHGTKRVRPSAIKNIKARNNENVDTYLKTSAFSIGLTTVSHLYLPMLAPLAVATVSYSVIPILRKTEKKFTDNRKKSPKKTEGKFPLKSSKKIDNSLLNCVVFVTCIATGHYVVTSISSCFYHLGDKMVTKIQDNSKKVLTDTFVQRPRRVWVLRDGVEVEISSEALRIGDAVVADAGEIIPIDGVIIKGAAMIDQHTLTGESAPAEKGAGEKVFASTLIISGKIHIQAEKLGMDTAISKIGNILLRTTDFKTNLQTKGEKWANGVASPLLITGSISAPAIGIMPAMNILYSSPGNMIKVLSSLQLLTHITLLSEHGILIKDGRTLETMPAVDTVLFDKTGTLTRDRPEVGKIFTFGDIGENSILTYAAIAEQRLSHPIAHAIRKKADDNGLSLSDISTEDSSYQIGYGITVSFEGRTICVGSLRFMTMQGMNIPEQVREARDSLQDKGGSLLLISIDNKIMGAMEILFPIRPEVRQTIHALRQRGIKYIAIVSGDHEQPTKKLAKTLKLDNYFHDVLPQDKAGIVEKLQNEGRTVCFVGDGVNDAIAIKKANVSISLNGATSVATDLAQVVLMDDNLSHIRSLFDISDELQKKTKESLFICTTYGVSTFVAGAVFQYGLVFPLTVGSAQLMAGLAHAAPPLARKNVHTFEK